MVRKALGISAALVVLLVLFLPFLRDLKDRYVIEHRLQNTLDPSELAALRRWNGSPASFVAMLRSRCELDRGAGASACDHYAAMTR